MRFFYYPTHFGSHTENDSLRRKDIAKYPYTLAGAGAFLILGCSKPVFSIACLLTQAQTRSLFNAYIVRTHIARSPMDLNDRSHLGTAAVAMATKLYVFCVAL